MTAMDPTNVHFSYVEKLRELRERLARETDMAQRDELLRQIKEIEEELEGPRKSSPAS